MMKMFNNKKGYEQLHALALFGVTLFLLISLSGTISQNLHDRNAENSSARNISTNTNNALQNFASMFPVVGLVLVAVVVISIVKLM